MWNYLCGLIAHFNVFHKIVDNMIKSNMDKHSGKISSCEYGDDTK